MPEGQPYNWGNTLGTIATMATGNPYIGIAVNHGFNWTRQDKSNNDNNSSYDTGKLANNVVTAFAARKSAKRRAQATQNAGKLDLGYLRTEAERNGFNPLTVLRATGGQGSRKSSDAGKLASAQFWQTFAQGMSDTNNNSVPVKTQPTMTAEEILAPVKLSNGKLNTDQNTAIYDVVQDPITLQYVNDGNSVFSAKQKSLDNVWVDPWGRKWRLPFEDLDLDTLVLGGVLKALAGSYHVGDITGKALREKLGKTFGWYGYKADKKTKGNTVQQLKKLQNQMNYKSGAISQKALGTLRNISAEDKKFIDFMKAQF